MKTLPPQRNAFSRFGDHLCGESGIELLMEDLGRAMAEGGESMRMLGGGNPARIPAMEDVWARRWQEMAAERDDLMRLLANYDGPQGNPRFLEAFAALLERTFGWPVRPENLAVTSGGQTAFFYLFNTLAGPMAHGPRRRIILPVVPEYIGYANQGVDGDLFRATRPIIEPTAPHRFKYRVDFDRLGLGEDAAAVCVSRPTNPTGNVLTDGEMERLSRLCRERGIPLVVDNAYGMPFPGILFREASPIWDEHIILTMSLSKLGLPGTRTAVVVASPEITRAVCSLTAVTGLANNNLGQAMVRPLVESGEILRLSRDVIRPFYEEKARRALAWVDEFFPDDLDYHVHESEGALFLWFWFSGLKIPARRLYERLKQRRVLVVPGEFFFFGLRDDDEDGGSWPHRHECLRVSYAMDGEVVREGLRILAEEAGRACREG